jgi:hypothetical protein
MFGEVAAPDGCKEQCVRYCQWLVVWGGLCPLTSHYRLQFCSIKGLNREEGLHKQVVHWWDIICHPRPPSLATSHPYLCRPLHSHDSNFSSAVPHCASLPKYYLCFLSSSSSYFYRTHGTRPPHPDAMCRDRFGVSAQFWSSGPKHAEFLGAHHKISHEELIVGKWLRGRARSRTSVSI